MQLSLTDSFLRMYVGQLATGQSRERKLQLLAEPAFLDSIPSSDAEMRLDWYNACDVLALQIAEGEIPFPLIAPYAYYLLEGTWWKRVKQASAYFRWKAEPSVNEQQHYDRASKALRKRLFAEQNRADLREFEKVRTYITERYLGDNQELADRTKTEAHTLVEKKAQRIWQTTGETRTMMNWFRARMYTTMFYENIVGAVIDNDTQKTARVIRAFEFSKSPQNRYLIINGFEAVISIYFLNKELVKSILNDPAAFDFSCVPVESWPEDVRSLSICADRFQYNADESQITYLGKMTEQERNALIDKVTLDEHRFAISHLYDQSHLSPYEDMVL